MGCSGGLRRQMFWLVGFSLMLGAGSLHAQPLEEKEEISKAQERVASMERQFGGEHLNTAMALHALADQLVQNQEWHKALDLFERALTIRIANQGSDHPLVSQTRISLAKLYQRMGDHASAATLLALAHNALQTALGPRHIQTAQAQIELAKLYRREPRRQEQVVVMLSEVLPILEEKLWKQHPGIAELLAIRADANFALGNFEQAEEDWLLALQIRENNFGRDHPTVAEVLRKLGRLQSGLGDLEGSEVRLRRALEIFQKTVGEEEPPFVETLASLSELLVFSKRYAEVLPMMEQILAIHSNKWGEDHPKRIKPMNDLALVHMSLNQLKLAKEKFQQSLTLSQKSLGESHLQSAFILGNLSEINQRLGEDQLAKKQFDRSIEVAKAFFEEDKLGLANWFSSIGATLHKSGSLEKATSLFNLSLALIESEFGPSHPQVLQVRQSLARLRIPVVEAQQPFVEVEKSKPEPEPEPVLIRSGRSRSLLVHGGDEGLVQEKMDRVLTSALSYLPDEERVRVLQVSQAKKKQGETALPPPVSQAVKEHPLTPVRAEGASALPEKKDEERAATAEKERAEAFYMEQKKKFTAFSQVEVVGDDKSAKLPERASLQDPDSTVAGVQGQKTTRQPVKVMTIKTISPNKEGSAIEIRSEKPPLVPPPQQFVIRMGCFLPATLLPKKVIETATAMDFPVYSQAKVLDKKIHSCLFSGPFMVTKEEVEAKKELLQNRLGLKGFTLLEPQEQ
ncbi:MAG: tetratricopeptide repeat protein [Magnetococcales bacterium]|nr:tetratricopeptide repeat protein [Magnetococcales bacterium]